MGSFPNEEPQVYEANGEKMKCVYCKNEFFFLRSAWFNTSSTRLFGLGRENRSVNCYICSKCNFVHWFAD
jgi:hypothetical protein